MMTIEEAAQILQNIMKPSDALDGFKHIDLTLVPPEKVPNYQKALFIADRAIKNGEVSKDDFMAMLKVK
jgi:hypothetical protein